MTYVYNELEQIKSCARCNSIKAFSEFNPRRAKSGPKVQSYCKTCCTENARSYRAKRSIYGYSLSEIQWYIELKEQPCTDCGVSFPYYCSDWDHTSEDKEDCIAHLLRSRASKDKILVEIAKCELVCAVCHRKRTHTRKEIKKNLPLNVSRRKGSFLK